jgi:CBS domain containing-hemolysin-like protein
MAEIDLIEAFFYIIIAFLLVLLNGFFVAAEFALVSVRPSKIEEILRKNPKNSRAKAVKQAIIHQDEIISATQLGITMASLALGFVGGLFLEPFIEELFHGIKIAGVLIGIAFGGIIAYAIVTYMHVVIGELVPKSVALQYKERTSLWVAKPLHWFAWLFTPIIKLFNGTGWLILRLFGMEPIAGHQAVHSEDELKLIISQSSKAGILDERETAILNRAFDLPDTQVRALMTPITDLTTINITDDFKEVIRIITQTGHSRFPVYGEAHEKIIGFLYAKDLLNYMLQLLEANGFDLKNGSTPDINEILREVDYVPETMRASLLLEKFQASRRQVAIVVDEFGSLAGLVSLEDVLELLVGDIQDEYDTEPVEITQLSEREGVSQVSGQISLDDFNKYFQSDFDSEISVTIGGLITERLGRIPDENEVIKMSGLEVTISEISDYRIQTILVDGKFKRDHEEEKEEETLSED